MFFMKISAFYLSEHLDLGRLKSAYAGRLLQENPSELFYQVDEEGYLYAFDHGVVVFARLSDTDVSKNLALMLPLTTRPLEAPLRDDFEVEEKPGHSLEFGFNRLVVPEMSEHVLRIVMLNVAYSVTLDYYLRQADQLLSEVQSFTNQLEQKGNIQISRTNMLRFIGRSLNSKNRIVENLYLFDSPEPTWEDEYLDRIHRGLSRTFELQARYKEIEYTFKVVEDNLTVFRELYHHRESSKLEWIIIILICIEVADLLISKLGGADI